MYLCMCIYIHMYTYKHTYYYTHKPAKCGIATQSCRAKKNRSGSRSSQNTE